VQRQEEDEETPTTKQRRENWEDERTVKIKRTGQDSDG
jgi:hypothetical protein